MLMKLLLHLIFIHDQIIIKGGNNVSSTCKYKFDFLYLDLPSK